MYRETDRGLALLRQGGAERGSSATRRRRARGRWRWASTLDPSYAFPLPIFGINYLDFAFKGPGLAAGAPVRRRARARATSSARSSGRRRSTRSVDFFAIAVPSSDRIYDANGEHEQERAADLAADHGRSISAGSTRRSRSCPANYQFRFDGFTSRHARPPRRSSFRRARSPTASAAGGSTAAAATARSRTARGTRAPAGASGACRADVRRRSQPSYVKYSASVSRDIYFNAVPQDSPERGVVRRPRSRSVRQVSVRDVRRHAHPRRAGLGRALPGARRRHAAPIRSTSSTSTGSTSSSSGPGGATGRSTTPGSRSPGSARRSTCGRRGIRSCAPTSARASCRTAIAASARRRCRL